MLGARRMRLLFSAKPGFAFSISLQVRVLCLVAINTEMMAAAHNQFFTSPAFDYTKVPRAIWVLSKRANRGAPFDLIKLCTLH